VTASARVTTEKDAAIEDEIANEMSQISPQIMAPNRMRRSHKIDINTGASTFHASNTTLAAIPRTWAMPWSSNIGRHRH
jgi:hypothetical protein